MSKIENLKNLSILYADDDDVLRESTVKILSMLFKTVYSAKDGEEAIEIFKNNMNINIIMLDIKMRLTSGIDVAKFIRSKNDNIPIFLVSSYTETADLIEACKLNLVDYIKKPFSFSVLSDTLIKCLSRISIVDTTHIKIKNDIFYNSTSKEIINKGINCNLTNNEIILLELLIERKSQLVSYETCMNKLGEDVSDAALKNIVLRLRKKLGDNVIKNLSKVGYTLTCN
jgi:DNA-binding response OmpR family regulator